MAYTSKSLSLIQAGGLYGEKGVNRNAQLWVYTSADNYSVVSAANYFSDAQVLGVQVADLLWVVDTTTNTVTTARFLTVTASGGTIASSASQDSANFRNLIDGGDFTVNPWQRNIAGIQTSASVLGAIASAATYFPDRWAAVSASSGGSVNVSLIADALLPGSKQHVQVARASANSNLGVVSFVQVIEPLDVYRAQGQQVVLSFYAKAGANFSAAGGTLTANVINGTGTVANTTVASMQAATWTNQQTTFSGAAVLSSAAWTRYQFSGSVPSAIASAAVTQMGVQFQFTPVGTASANDWVQLDLIQLEVGGSASVPERRDAEVELALCQRYAFVYPEPAASVAVMMMAPTAANVQTGAMSLPTPMVSAPTVSVAAGSFKLVIDAQTSVAATSMAAGVGHSLTGISITTSATATATAHSVIMIGGGGAGYILASADY